MPKLQEETGQNTKRIYLINFDNAQELQIISYLVPAQSFSNVGTPGKHQLNLKLCYLIHVANESSVFKTTTILNDITNSSMGTKYS